MENLPSAQQSPTFHPPFISSVSVERLLCVGPVLGPGSQGPYSPAGKTGMQQASSRRHGEREML